MNYNIKVAVTCDVVGQVDVTAISGYTPLNPSKDGCTGTRGFRLVATDQVITRTDIGRALVDRQTDRHTQQEGHEDRLQWEWEIRSWFVSTLHQLKGVFTRIRLSK
jgi:hypothetical protein